MQSSGQPTCHLTVKVTSWQYHFDKRFRRSFARLVTCRAASLNTSLWSKSWSNNKVIFKTQNCDQRSGTLRKKRGKLMCRAKLKISRQPPALNARDMQPVEALPWHAHCQISGSTFPHVPCQHYHLIFVLHKTHLYVALCCTQVFHHFKIFNTSANMEFL